MGETKFRGKSGAHSENFRIFCKIFAMSNSEKILNFFDFFFFEKSNKIINK